MKNWNRIYIFFILVALAFWNPVSFYFFYRNTGVYESGIFHILFWLICVSGITLIYIIQKNKLSEKIRNFIFFFSCSGVLFSVLVYFNAILGILSPSIKLKRNAIIYEPYSIAEYKTSE